MNRLQRILAKTHLAISLVPWAALAFYTLYAVLMRRALGHWPVFRDSTPDGFLQWFSRAEDYFSFGLIFSIPVWLCLLALRFGVKGAQWRTVWRPTFIFAVGWAVVLFIACIDPCNFIDWILD